MASGARRRALAALLVALAAAPAFACSEVEEEAVSGYEPAALEPAPGGDGATRVTFTREGAARIALATAPVRREGPRSVVPSRAVLYDAGGGAFVYVATGPRSFLRRDVEVERVAGGRAMLAGGPAAGSLVVTVGAAEVHGVELEIAGSH
jgi:hypothetical protein